MLRRLVVLLTVSGAFFALTQPAIAAPPRVEAWYMYGTTLGGLQSNAWDHGNSFALNHPDGNRLMVLDFGAARKVDADTWGALDFSGTLFGNPSILSALEWAADGHHNGYQYHPVGSTVIAYGNSNYNMSGSGMDTGDAWYAGYYQSQRARNLYDYQQAHGYNVQSSDAASDMEPSWDGQLITKQLVNGDTSEGWALYYNFGSADGCPSSGDSGGCNNGWDVGDVAYVSYKGLAVPIPEIYYSVNADQWTVVRRWWDTYSSGGFYFFGSTGTSGVGLSPGEGWNALDANNPGLVLSELICFC